ncbi:Hypothetical protein LUCI_0196 [Lucifera butyrica]|uniref:DUF3311 domain-containing protein n=2 Tax=Lucifera butyrica TaxID=1351585 RepID=A0A498R2J5_9FIRM|nr:Hypothetical protein LUCI_0196 [Lucifera butyrica]
MNFLKVTLTLIPFIWTIGMIPLANRVTPFIFGLPFLAFWLVAGVFVAFFCIQCIYRIDSKNVRNL